MSARAVDNHIVIDGVVDSAPETRTTPAGVPISRFLLRHSSMQEEAGGIRKTECSLPVMAAGEALRKEVAALGAGQAVKVEGFLARANAKLGEYRLVLHATAIRPLDTISE